MNQFEINCPNLFESLTCKCLATIVNIAIVGVLGKFRKKQTWSGKALIIVYFVDPNYTKIHFKNRKQTFSVYRLVSFVLSHHFHSVFSISPYQISYLYWDCSQLYCLVSRAKGSNGIGPDTDTRHRTRRWWINPNKCRSIQKVRNKHIYIFVSPRKKSFTLLHYDGKIKSRLVMTLEWMLLVNQKQNSAPVTP